MGARQAKEENLALLFIVKSIGVNLHPHFTP
jgi:hypothetical protein